MPPPATATNTVLPDGSVGSTAKAEIRAALAVSFVGAGPTGVQFCRVSEFVGSCVKMRNAAWKRSAVACPKPVVATLRGKVSDQFTI